MAVSAGVPRRPAPLRCGTEARAWGVGGWSREAGVSAWAGARGVRACAGTWGEGLHTSSPQALTPVLHVRMGPPGGVGPLGSGLELISPLYSSVAESAKPAGARIPLGMPPLPHQVGSSNSLT